MADNSFGCTSDSLDIAEADIESAQKCRGAMRDIAFEYRIFFRRKNHRLYC